MLAPSMTLIDFLTTPWAIVPEKLLELQAIYATHLRGDKIDLAAIEARLGRPLANEQKSYELQGNTGVAVLDISGVISPKANMFTRISGGTAASILQTQVTSMANDPKVKSVLLNFDTPGGNVLGIPAAAEAIAALAACKPTAAVSTGTMASAGYWLASAANAVYVSGSTDFVGSIGVVATHAYDPRSADVQKTEITAGKYKRMASEGSPLSAEGRAYLQSQVDHLYGVFVDAVAAYRGASADVVQADMADGRIFIGQQAIDAGLADGMATVDALVERLATNPAQFANRRATAVAMGATASHPVSSKASAVGVAAPAPTATAGPVLPKASTQPSQGAIHMTPQEQAAAFAAEHPDAAALLRAEGSTNERTRIQAVRAQSMPGNEPLIEQLAFDGATTGPEAAVQVLAAERGRLAKMGLDRAADAPKPVLQAAADTHRAAGPAAATSHAGYAVEPKAAQLDAKARAYIAANPGTDYLAAVKAAQQQPDLQGA